MHLNILNFFLCVLLGMLSACGGGGSSTTTTMVTYSVSSSASVSSKSSIDLSSMSSATNSSISHEVYLSGIITFDYVPHNSNGIGLNYAATEKRPVRGAVVEAVDDAGHVLASDNLSAVGGYKFALPIETFIKIRVKAQLTEQLLSPKYNFRVTNNTNGNALYVIETALASTGSANSTRNLHAASGWSGVEYTGGRSAAPFAILDFVYTALNKLNAAGNKRDLRDLDLRWSPLNKEARGDETKGEIETSSYDGVAIYLLGDENHDTDEYDGNVLIHEWGHFLEDNLFRSDSLGGTHTDEDYLDMRVAMSEGWANAFSGMMLGSANYTDASGNSQADGFSFDVAQKNPAIKGYYSEISIGSIFMNFYLSDKNKTANDWSPILSAMNQAGYYDSSAFVSIFLFYEQLKQLNTNQAKTFYSLMQEQNINGTDAFATGETNNASLNNLLPLYKNITIGGAAVNLCSSPLYGKYNKLGNSAFVRLNIPKSANYHIAVTKTQGAAGKGVPEVYIFRTNLIFGHLNKVVSEGLSETVNLSAGSYLVELFDQSNRDEDNNQSNTFCYDLKVE